MNLYVMARKSSENSGYITKSQLLQAIKDDILGTMPPETMRSQEPAQISPDSVNIQ